MYFQQGCNRGHAHGSYLKTGGVIADVAQKCQYGRKVKQMLVVLIRPLQYLCLILSGCCLLDICFDLPGQDVRHQVRAVVAWWQESDNDSRILSFVSK
ncbi:hypothetical protein UA45_06110 [Morganella morganii]|uniref:Uncharacterized protein n=1 Tax=Morganella morganii TaxID=582 RepID=A0A0D8L9A4_MORMO|nr:hypothetical protein UA45_06110 [Morganella morganii]